jgi:hypothetical protein
LNIHCRADLSVTSSWRRDPQRNIELTEPSGLILVTALKANQAIHHVEESASFQGETPAVGCVSGKLAAKRVTAGPFDDHPFAILEDLIDVSVAIGKCAEERREVLADGLSSPRRLV